MGRLTCNDITSDPTIDPTAVPTFVPTADPTSDPTEDPTIDPTSDPTKDPTVEPTIDPTADPTIDPTADPTADPTNDPSVDPTKDPTIVPTSNPSSDPTNVPTANPTRMANEDGEILTIVEFEISGDAATVSWVEDNAAYLIDLFIASSNISSEFIDVSIGSVTRFNNDIDFPYRRRMAEATSGVKVEFLVTIIDATEYNEFKENIQNGAFEINFDNGLTDETFINDNSLQYENADSFATTMSPTEYNDSFGTAEQSHDCGSFGCWALFIVIAAIVLVFVLFGIWFYRCQKEHAHEDDAIQKPEEKKKTGPLDMEKVFSAESNGGFTTDGGADELEMQTAMCNILSSEAQQTGTKVTALHHV